MKKIAIMTPKGGVGKTTTATTIAYILGEEKGKKVLIIDGDAQGDTSHTFNKYDPYGKGTSELLENLEHGVLKKYTMEEIIQHTRYKNVDIITGNNYLMRTDMELLRQTESNDQISRLKQALKLTGFAKYDYIIMDCGRLFDMVVFNMVIAADMIIAPVKLGGFETRAIGELLEQIENIKDSGENTDIEVKILLTMQQKNKVTEQVEEWLRTGSGYDVLKSKIRRSVVAEKATIAEMPLPAFSKNSIAAKDYRELVTEIAEEIK